MTPARGLDAAIGPYDAGAGLVHHSEVVRRVVANIHAGGWEELPRFRQATEPTAAPAVLPAEALAAATGRETGRRIRATPFRQWFEQTRRAFSKPVYASPAAAGTRHRRAASQPSLNPRKEGNLNMSRTSPQTALAVLTASTLLFAACGGGGGSTPTAMPAQPPADTGFTRHTSQGPSAARVTEYLYQHAGGGPRDDSHGERTTHSGLVRFASPPTARMTTGMTERERAITHYGIALVNRALPYDQHIRIGADAPSVVAKYGSDLQGKVPDGEIFIEFHRDGASGRASPAVSHHDYTAVYDDRQQRWEKTMLRAAQVEMDSEFFEDRPDHQAVSVVVHELLHAIGLHRHPSGEDFPDSNMYDAWFRLDGSLPAIDAAGILALYTRLTTNTEPEELSVTSLGAWEETTTDLTRQLSAVSFGVRHGNGVTMPWTQGTEPGRTLAGNPRLNDSATWNGDLIGFTSTLSGVRGEAEVRVNLNTMNGRADFTALEHEDGSMWGDGDLGYTITVGANYLRSTGGDAGTVNGQFYGSNHEGVGGSVERADLTAAFGAKRQ